jgi:hypothetical protein
MKDKKEGPYLWYKPYVLWKIQAVVADPEILKCTSTHLLSSENQTTIHNFIFPRVHGRE